MTDKVALIAGVGGTCGANLAEMLIDQGGWRVIGLSRTRPELRVDIEHRSVDFLDRAGCPAALGDVSAVTHIFWTALLNGKTREEENALNTRMFENFMDAALPGINTLEHVHVLEGVKQYGYDLGPYKTPCYEDDPDGQPAYFYSAQHAHTLKCQQGENWSWSTTRPGAVCGYSYGGRINLMTVLAVYATIMKEMGEPLYFPGDEATYNAITFATDVGLLNRMMIWASTDSAAANQAFNAANGDHFRWCHMWPLIADMFDMPAGPVRPTNLQEVMADKEPLWQDIIERHGLKPSELHRIAPWKYADTVFRRYWDNAINTVKANQFGFTEMIDTRDMMKRIFNQFREQKVIP